MLRFKRNDGTPFPNWKEYRLEDITERIIVGLATSVTPYYRENGIPLMRNMNIKKNLLDDSDVLYLEEDYAKSQTGKMIKTDDILTVHTGSNICLSCVVPAKYDGSLTFTTLITTPKKDIIDSEYLCQYMNSDIGYARLNTLTTAGGKPNLNSGDMINLRVPVPCIEEQKKIAKLLASIDKFIQSTETEIEELEIRKKEIMRQIFSQEICFKKESGESYPEWKHMQLSECCNGYDNMRKPVAAAQREAGEIPYYGANGIQDYVKDYIFDGEYVLLAEDGGNFDDFYNRPIAQFISGKTWVNNHAHIIQANELALTKYVFYTLVHKDIRKYINGTSRAKLNQADMWKITIPIPCLEEQQKIATLFTKLDEQISFTKEELETWTTIKNGLLQQFFE